MPIRGKLGKPSLSPAESDRVRAELELLLRDRFKGNRTALGKALSRSQPSISLLLNGTNAASLETARRVAKLAGASVTRYLDETHVSTPVDAKFPSKADAARAAHALSFPAWAVARMLGEEPEELTADPGAMYWFRRVEQFAQLPAPAEAPRPPPRAKAMRRA